MAVAPGEAAVGAAGLRSAPGQRPLAGGHGAPGSTGLGVRHPLRPTAGLGVHVLPDGLGAPAAGEGGGPECAVEGNEPSFDSEKEKTRKRSLEQDKARDVESEAR